MEAKIEVGKATQSFLQLLRLLLSSNPSKMYDSDDPKTRSERKGRDKDANDSHVYGKKRVRQLEAILETKRAARGRPTYPSKPKGK